MRSPPHAPCFREANATPKTHDGSVEALRALKVLQRSATKARTQALNQLQNLLVTAPDALRARLRDLPIKELLNDCAAFRVAADDDTLNGITRFALRELAQRVLDLDQRREQVRARLHRITAVVAPELIALKGIGPDVAATLLLTAGDNPQRLRNEAVLRRTLRHQPRPSQQRQDPTSPAQPRRRPPSELSSLAHHPGPHGQRPTHQGLHGKARQRRQE